MLPFSPSKPSHIILPALQIQSLFSSIVIICIYVLIYKYEDYRNIYNSYRQPVVSICIYVLIYKYIVSKYNLLYPYTVTCMYVFSACLTLDNQLACSPFWRAISMFPVFLSSLQCFERFEALWPFPPAVWHVRWYHSYSASLRFSGLVKNAARVFARM